MCNADNIETSESWLGFASAAAECKTEPDSLGSPSWLKSQGGAGMEGGPSRGLGIQAALVSVCVTGEYTGVEGRPGPGWKSR